MLACKKMLILFAGNSNRVAARNMSIFSPEGTEKHSKECGNANAAVGSE